MIITKVLELKNAGVWKNFTSHSDVRLAPRTLIYGLNGSGKTTLSRVFSSIELGVINEHLPQGAAFKIGISDGEQITQALNPSAVSNNLLVFNTDFISRNFKWDTASSSNGIVYLSRDKVDARSEYDALKPRHALATKNITDKKAAKDKAGNTLKEFNTRVARNVREMATSSSYTQAYDAKKIKGRFEKKTFGPDDRLSDTDLQNFKEILALRAPLPNLTFSASLPAGFTDWFNSSYFLLTESIPSIAMKELQEHSDMLRWIEEGLNYHNDHSVSDCLLCGNPFSDERRNKLRGLFDASWDNALQTLNDASKKGEHYQEELRAVYRALPKEVEVAVEERESFKKNSKAMQTAITNLGNCVGELISGLKIRTANPTVQVDAAEHLVDFNLNDWLNEYKVIESAVANIIKSHNSASDSFQNQQQSAFSNIETHILATNQAEWNKLKKAVADCNTEYETAISEEGQLSTRVRELQNTLQDHGIGAEKMNELIGAYLGHSEISLVADGGGYNIIRSGREPAMELSEGERMAISFCYFLTQLGAEGRVIKDLILVIDDPVSSLDTTARTHAYSMMMRMVKKCAQVIILTHNASFMNMVKREFQNLAVRHSEKEVTALLSLDCRSIEGENGRTTSLAPMNDLLIKYGSEYHYLFSLVRNAAQEGRSNYLFLLPNATRKLLEIFSTFCSPGQSNFTGALMDHHEVVKDKLDVRALERLVQIESHGTIEGLGNLPELTLEEAINAAKAAIKFIEQVSKEHYKKMIKVCT